uniref:Uncharacterized protein n=1 Tax=Streptomyces longisporoflavus TaxID=28044 RepID=D7F1L1_9ACTN|nr:hypothetical protein [Streptomyces longisporoflavus]
MRLGLDQRRAELARGHQVHDQERHGHHHEAEHPERGRGRQALAEVVVRRPDRREDDAADTQERRAEQECGVAVPVLPDLLPELPRSQHVDEDDAEDQKDHTERAVGAGPAKSVDYVVH